MTRNTVIQSLAVLAAILAVAGAAVFVSPIEVKRRELQLSGVGSDLGGDLPPKEVIAGAALGMFRGLAVDVLWYRINQLKEEGKFFEINALAQSITTLQPRFPQVWSFHAWNMAYNVSVMTHTPMERWDWINKGITLLRDKGIPYNPRSVRLYRELSWIFFHKVGQFSDEMCWYYKQQLAREWQTLLGTPTEGATKAEAVAAFALIAHAPDTVEALRTESPAVVPLLDRLHTLGLEPGPELLNRIGRIMLFTYSTDAKAFGATVDNFEGFDEVDRKLSKAIAEPDLAPGLAPLMAHLRKRTLIDHYHMDPAFMLYLMETLGPLDWRHPAAHAAYWSTLGTSKSVELRNKTDIDLINTYRGNIHAMQELMVRGRISYDPVSDRIDLLPDPRFIAAYEKALLMAREEILQTGLYTKESTDSFNDGYENFLLSAVVFSYLYGDMEESQKYYEKIRLLFGSRPDRIVSGIYSQSLESLVYKELADSTDSSAGVRQLVDGLLSQAFSQGLANGRAQVFDRFATMAKYAHDHFAQFVKGPPNVAGVRDRRSPLPWDQEFMESYISYMRQPGLAPLNRYRIWINSSDDLRRAVFDRLKDPVRQMATKAELDPEQAFPEPSGMDEYRKAHPVAGATTRPAETTVNKVETK